MAILDYSEVSTVFPKLKQTVVLVGGCFDILHVGHICFLEAAKKQGQTLVVLLESDQKIKKTKGENRPINTQLDRAKMLVSLRVVDYVILLPFLEKGEEYDQLIKKINPQIIATTKGDLTIQFKKRSAQLVNAQVLEVTDYIADHSTTKILSLT